MTTYKRKLTPKQTIIGGVVLSVLFCCGCSSIIGALSDSGQEGFKDGVQAASDSDATTAPAPAVTTAEAAPTSEPSTAVPTPTTPRKTAPKATPRRTTAAPKAAAPYYKNCDQAYDAGVAPLFEGEPGYRPALDADGDGEACEGREGNGDPGPGSEGDVYYANCSAVRAAGADPIRRGQPGYGRHLDRDGDGIGCE